MFEPGFSAEDEEREFEWVQRYDHFDQRPASILEFLGEKYLNIDRFIRPGVRQALVDVFGEEPYPDRVSKVREGMFTGAIGVGKTTFASVAIPYALHWAFCMRNPQEYFNFAPGSRIHFMLMSTTENQAKDILFSDIKARIASAPWFQRYCLPDPRIKNLLIFPKGLEVIPGNSQETRFEGYNILAGFIDEGDSHKVTDSKDFAEAGWNTIRGRIKSRFPDVETNSHRGLLMAIGQMKRASGFMNRKMGELLKDTSGQSHVAKLTIWESYGWEFFRDKKTGKFDIFYYDTARKEIIPPAVAKDIASGNPDIIPIPTVYLKEFQTDPVKALRDLGGIPPLAGDPFIPLAGRIVDAQDRWVQRFSKEYIPVDSNCVDPKFSDLLLPDPKNGSIRRCLHVDMAYSSGKGSDALGMAMGYVAEIAQFDNEEKAIIDFDFLLRMKAPPGGEIIFADVRQLIYELRRRGFRIAQVTVDRVAGTDFIQTLNRAKIPCDTLSVDKSKAPFEDLKDAINERRCNFPPYMTQLVPDSDTLVNVAYKELSQLEDMGRKIDHPPQGSKDVADAMAAVVHILQSSALYRRGAVKRSAVEDLATYEQVTDHTQRLISSDLGIEDRPPVELDVKTPQEALGATYRGIPLMGPIMPDLRSLRQRPRGL